MVATRSHRPAEARESVPEGHLKVAHYEVVGKSVKDSSVPKRDDRTLSPWLAYGLASASGRSIIPGGTGRFWKNTIQHFVVGHYQMVPSSFALRATADRPGRGPLRMLLSLKLTRMGSCRTTYRGDCDIRSTIPLWLVPGEHLTWLRHLLRERNFSSG